MLRHLLLVSLCCLFIAAAALSAVAQESVDNKAKALFIEYRKFSTAGLSAEERIARYKEWRSKLESLLAQKTSDDEVRAKLLREILYICNALGDRTQSFNMLDELLKRKGISEREQIEWLTEYGEVARTGVILSHGKDRAMGLKGVEMFEKANKLIKQQGNSQGLLEQKILNLAWAGDILEYFEESTEDLSKGREFYRQAAAARRTFDEPSARMKGKGTSYDLEHFLYHEAKISAQLDDIDAAEKVLQSLADMPNNTLPMPMSCYVREAAEIAFLNRGKDPRDFLIRWVSNHPDDERTCVLVTYIAESYMQRQPEGYLDAVLPWLTELVDGKYAEPLLTLERDLIEQKISGGPYACALLAMIRVCEQKKDYKTAKIYNDRYLAMFPYDKANVPIAKRDAEVFENEIVMQEIESKTQKPRSVIPLLLSIAFFAGVLCIIYFYRSRGSK